MFRKASPSFNESLETRRILFSKLEKGKRMAYMLETNALTKTFKGQTAVDHVSLHVPEGSVYGLLGPNGAGKSTLLKMVCGMLRPTSGSIALAGRPWTRADLDGIGALIETPPLYDNLTARENLRVRTTLLGVAPSGVPLEAGDALGTFGGDAACGIAVALALFAALAIAGAAWFSKREAA